MRTDDLKIKKISEKKFLKKKKVWAVTIPEGAIVVRSRDNAICFQDFSNGQIYALNGVARMIGIQPIDPIWRKTGQKHIIPQIDSVTGEALDIPQKEVEEQADLTDMINVGLDLLGIPHK